MSRPRASALQVLILTGFGGVIAFGCGLRFWKIASIGFWYDELWAVVGAIRPFTEMYREWILGDSHPPGLFLFNFLWFSLVPTTEFWARIPHALAGVASVIYLLLGTRDVLTREERVLSASFMSLCSLAVRYAFEVKQYSPMLLLATVATMSYLRIVTTGRVDRRPGLTLCATCVSMAYLNYFATVYAGLLLLLLTLTFRRDRRALRSMLRLDVAFGVCYLPLVYFLYLQLVYSPDAWQMPNMDTFPSDLLTALFFDDSVHVQSALGIFAGALIVAAIVKPDVRATLRSTRTRHLLLLWLCMTGFILALGLSEPIFFPRYFLITFPVFFILVGTLAAAVFPMRNGLALLPLAFFATAAVAQFHTVATMRREAWGESVDLVLEEKKPDDRVFVLGADARKTSFDYLKEGNVDGLFYVKNVKFYDYYFTRRGSSDVARQLQVVEPTVASVGAFVDEFEGSGATVYVLAGHEIAFSGDALAALQRRAAVETSALFRTLVYRVTFRKPSPGKESRR